MPYADVLARNARAARARISLDQETLASRMSYLGFTAWRRQTVASVERGKRRLTAEEVLGLSLALVTTVQALLLPANEDDSIALPSGRALPGPSVQSSVMGFLSPAVWERDGTLNILPAGMLPMPSKWPPGGPPLRGGQAEISDGSS